VDGVGDDDNGSRASDSGELTGGDRGEDDGGGGGSSALRSACPKEKIYM